MANKNTNLQNAKNKKDDEFYTTYEDIEKEIINYKIHFKNKTVFCNCDNPFESNFCKYFLKNFNVLEIKRLICTSYYSSKIISKELKGTGDIQSDECLNYLKESDIVVTNPPFRYLENSSLLS